MKKIRMEFRRQNPWLILIFFMNLFFVFFLWIVSAARFRELMAVLLLFTLLTMLIGIAIGKKQQKDRMSYVRAFLEEPKGIAAERLSMAVDPVWAQTIAELSDRLAENERLLAERTAEAANYQEYMEEWAHEIKTPLALVRLVLENRREEMTPYVYRRMEYVRQTISANVERVLYYARLQVSHVDYLYEHFDLEDMIGEKLEEFGGLISEKQVDLQLDLSPVQVMCDKKVLSFLLAQIFSNAFKYAAAGNAVVQVKTWTDRESGAGMIAVRDNGSGVSREDLPFIFDKGFTGDSTKRESATGMGLYFVKKYAEALSIHVQVEEKGESVGGFGIRLVFPEVC